MEIEVEGLDEAIKHLDGIAHGLTLEGVNEECDKIKLAAKKCGITSNDVYLEAVPNGKDFEIKAELKDPSKMDCLKRAIKEAMANMPDPTKFMFENLLEQMEKDEAT